MAMIASRLRRVFATRYSSNPVEQQLRVVEGFRRTAAETRLAPWAPGDAIPDGSFVLVGVMVGWNTYDQELAVALDEAVSEGRVENERLAVFAADDLRTREAIEAVFPGVRGIGQSPYVGVWEDGELRLVDSGPSAMSFLADRYGLTLP